MDRTFAFASNLKLDHIILGFQADAERLLEIVDLFYGRLLLGFAPLLSLLLCLLLTLLLYFEWVAPELPTAQL